LQVSARLPPCIRCTSHRSSRGHKGAAYALDGRLEPPGPKACTGAVLHDMVQCCGARASDGARCGSAWECSRAGSPASYQAAAAYAARSQRQCLLQLSQSRTAGPGWPHRLINAVVCSHEDQSHSVSSLPRDYTPQLPGIRHLSSSVRPCRPLAKIDRH